MDHGQENSNVSEQQTENYPSTPHFDDAMIAAARPVELLPAKQASAHSERWSGIPKKTRLVAALMGSALLLGAVGGVFFGLRDRVAEADAISNSSEPVTAKPEVTSQPGHTTQSVSVTAPSVKDADKHELQVKQSTSTIPLKIDFADSDDRDKADKKPVARKVAEISFDRGRGKKSKKEKHGRGDDDH